LPVTISSVQVHGAKNTRKDFLDPIFEPIVTGSRDADFTMAAMLEQVGEAVQKLQKFGTNICVPHPHGNLRTDYIMG